MKLLAEIIGPEEAEAELDTTAQINKTLARKIMLKIQTAGTAEDQPHVLGEKDLNKSAVREESEVSLTKCFDQPPSLRVCIFQLSESNDLERVTFILQSIGKYSKPDLISLKKAGLVAKITKVIQKYCNGDYGFDQDVSKLGNFQYCVVKALITLSDSFLDFVEFLQGGVFTMLGQIVEEAFIYIYDKTVNMAIEWNSKLPKFVNEALQLFELGVNLKCSKQYEEMKGVYSMLRQRLAGLTPQELNISKVFKTFFPDKSSGEIMEDTEDSTNKDLKVVCPVLYNARIKVDELIVKLDALKEYSETHQDKYSKLFNPGVALGAVPISEKKHAAMHNRTVAGLGGDKNISGILEQKMTL